MAGYEFIKVSVEDGIATITLDRPPLNVLNTAMLAEMATALEPLAADRQIAAIVLRAAGKAFSAGADIADHTAEKVHAMLDRFHAVLRMLLSTDALTIAAVQGAALGGGCELAIACDVVLASEKARFGQPEIKLAVFPPVAACILPRRVGVAKAVEINAVGEPIAAAEAHRIGLASHLLPVEGFDARVDEYLGIVKQLSRPVVRLAKRSTAGPMRAEMLEHLERAERLYLDELMALSDAGEGLNAFLQKRAPVWKHA